jgi:hypothetical protein
MRRMHQMNIYEQAAKRANVPHELVDEATVRASTALHDKIVQMVADHMHETVMDHAEEHREAPVSAETWGLSHACEVRG